MTRMECAWIEGKDAFRLTKAYPVNLNSIGGMGMIVIPSGFVCDGASIPVWIVGKLFIHPFHHTVRRAGLIHDYLYHIRYPRGKADAIFRNVCKADGANRVQVWAMYSALRAFGWMRY